MRTLITLYLGLLGMMLFTVRAQAQFSIPTNTYQPSVGSMLEFAQASFVDDPLYATVTSGSGGGNSWDFSSLGFTAPYDGTSVDPATAPAIDSFPTANLVIRYPLGNDTSWNYFRSVASEYSNLGTVSHTSGTEFVNVRDNSTPEYSFPLDYQDTWTIIRDRSDTTSPQIYSETFDTTMYEADAYGNAVYNTNSVSCLRVKSVQRQTTITYLNGTPFMTTTLVNETVQFISDGFGVPMSVGRTSINGQPFTNWGSGLGSFYNTPTDIVETDPGTLPDGFGLAQNYPNPFNPTTDIRFSVPQVSNVRLVVYNVLGQQAKVLINQQLPAGSYTVDWDGTDQSGNTVASGIYFYRLETGDFTASKKMLLLK